MIALANHLPRVRVPWVSIGIWPTPVTAVAIDGRPVWVKHEGDAHPLYGGNKIRTPEPWFGLADQIAAHDAPPPARIVLPVGSTCTTAGLLAGLLLAQAIGVWRWPLPIVHGVRVTPWPITSRVRTADLARRTLVRVERLGG